MLAQIWNDPDVLMRKTPSPKIFDNENTEASGTSKTGHLCPSIICGTKPENWSIVNSPIRGSCGVPPMAHPHSPTHRVGMD